MSAWGALVAGPGRDALVAALATATAQHRDPLAARRRALRDDSAGGCPVRALDTQRRPTRTGVNAAPQRKAS